VHHGFGIDFSICIYKVALHALRQRSWRAGAGLLGHPALCGLAL